MRLYLPCAIVFVFLGAILPVSASPWLLVAVPQTEGKNGQILNISTPFKVILSNTTTHNLTIWKDWCSWGYFNLSFEFKGKDGKIVTVKKSSGAMWDRNFPDGFVVLPGCDYTFTVDFFGKNEWKGEDALDGPMTMTVIYRNTSEAFPGLKSNPPLKFSDYLQKEIDSAWVGEVKSKPLPVTIVR